MGTGRISKTTQLCMSLSGRPGNFGTRFQNHLYDALGLDYIYKAFTTSDLSAAIGGIRALGIRGCAISMPFKEACIPMLDALDPSAAAIGSVNTIVNDDGRLTGYNTDYIAIQTLIATNAISPKTPLLLRGSGGMGKAVTCAFRDAGFAHGTLIARNEQAGRALAESCGYAWAPVPDGLTAPLIVNITPIGMAGGSEADQLAYPEATVHAAKIVFDVVALPAQTPLIKSATAAGKTVIDGGQVVVLQGLEQFALYTGVRPDTALVAEAAAIALA